MFRVVLSPTIRSANNCIYNIWYLSHCYFCLSLSWNRWNWFECAVGGLRHPQHTQTFSTSSTTAADSSNGVTNTRCCRYSFCAPDDGWCYHPKHVEEFPDKINCVTLHIFGYILLEYLYYNSSMVCVLCLVLGVYFMNLFL
jgi:hypothetical protein